MKILCAYTNGFVREMIAMSESDFDQLEYPEITGFPVYYCWKNGKLKVWPKPSHYISICTLEPQEFE